MELLTKASSGKRIEAEDEVESQILGTVAIGWLANPLTAVISARGNAEALVIASVLYTLLLLRQGKVRINVHHLSVSSG